MEPASRHQCRVTTIVVGGDACDSIATRSSGRPRPSRRDNLAPSHKSGLKDPL